MAVTGNVERLAISRFKATLFGEHSCEPIVKWVCGVKCGVHDSRIQYSTMDNDELSLTGKWGSLKIFFVRGSPLCFGSEYINGARAR